MNEKNNIKTCTFFVKGMHCTACEIVIEDKLNSHTCIDLAKANLSSNTVTLHMQEEVDSHKILTELNELIKAWGYELTHQKDTALTKPKTNELIIAFFISTLLVAIFALLQKLGIVNILNAEQITLPFIFLIGVVASLSTCMAVVGGLVLSLSSTYTKTNTGASSTISLFNFHISRLVSFFILGGLIGIIGTAFTLSTATTFIINVLLFFVMLLMGINLLDLFPATSRLQPRLPKILGQKFLALQEHNGTWIPILLGTSTFFLPCGFTQSMQIYSLSTGNFVNGALTMFVFALGTLPVLALISFASVKLAKGLQSGLFFKTAGFLILFFAVFNFLGALAALGIIEPIINI